MKQDVNKIINTLNAEWAQDLSNAKRKLAVAVEENRLLKAEMKQMKADQEENKKEDDAE